MPSQYFAQYIIIKVLRPLKYVNRKNSAKMTMILAYFATVLSENQLIRTVSCSHHRYNNPLPSLAAPDPQKKESGETVYKKFSVRNLHLQVT